MCQFFFPTDLANRRYPTLNPSTNKPTHFTLNRQKPLFDYYSGAKGRRASAVASGNEQPKPSAMGWLDAFGPIAWLDAFCPIGFQAIPIWLSLGRHPISRQTIQISVKINKKQFKDLPSFFILRQTIQISVKNEIKNNSNIYLAANNSIICRPFVYLAANNSNICRPSTPNRPLAAARPPSNPVGT